MANEFFRAYGPDAAITISPRGQGIMEVFLDGEKIFDKKYDKLDMFQKNYCAKYVLSYINETDALKTEIEL